MIYFTNLLLGQEFCPDFFKVIQVDNLKDIYDAEIDRYRSMIDEMMIGGGWSLAKIANTANLSVRTLKRIIKRETNNPTLVTKNKMEDAYDIFVNWECYDE